jgi:hypothetical protein
MGLQMFPKVADLAEGGLAVAVSTLVGFFFCMGHQMTIELGDTVDHAITLLTANFISKLAVKYFVLFF